MISLVLKNNVSRKQSLICNKYIVLHKRPSLSQSDLTDVSTLLILFSDRLIMTFFLSKPEIKEFAMYKAY